MDKMTSDFITMLRSEIQDRQEEIADLVATGGCSSFDEYQRQVGRVEGFQMVKQMIKDRLEKLIKLQDDEIN